MRPQQYVYYVLNLGLVKIGVAEHPTRRLQALRTAAPFCELLGFERGGMEVERSRHVEFEEDRVGFEWFLATDRLVSFALALPRHPFQFYRRPDCPETNGYRDLWWEFAESAVPPGPIVRRVIPRAERKVPERKTLAPASESSVVVRRVLRDAQCSPETFAVRYKAVVWGASSRSIRRWAEGLTSPHIATLDALKEYDFAADARRRAATYEEV